MLRFNTALNSLKIQILRKKTLSSNLSIVSIFCSIWLGNFQTKVEMKAKKSCCQENFASYVCVQCIVHVYDTDFISHNYQSNSGTVALASS